MGESKTLHTIQIFAKIGRVLSMIAYIFCIIGAVGCLLGFICLAAGLTGVVTIGGVSVHSFIETTSGMPVEVIYGYMIVGFMICIFEICLAKMAKDYFKHELRVGTPFTFEGAAELKRLGICMMVITLVGNILISIVIEVFLKIQPVVEELTVSTDNIGHIGTGLVILAVSFLCKYGAELAERKETYSYLDD